MNSEIIAALSQLVADEQRDDETLVDTLTRIKSERDRLRLECEQHPYHEACPRCWEKYQDALRTCSEMEERIKQFTIAHKHTILAEVSLAALLFGDDHTAGKGFREMAARVRELLIVANAAADVCGPFAMLDYQGRELVPARDMDRLRAALQPLIVKASVAAETGKLPKGE